MGLQLTGALSHFWYIREHHSESRMWLQSALERGSAATAARAKVLVGAGRLAWFQGELARANTLLEESLTLYQALGDDAGAAFALLVLGRIAVSQGDRGRGSGSTKGVVFFLGGGFLELSGSSRTGVSESVGLWLQVRDVDAVGRAFGDDGVEIIEPPTDKPWGLREMQIRDPDGLRIVIVEVPETHPLRRR
jgi:catechol 2,3-dioxygenase-like lactoylglutathione lyase family enzyme